MYTNNHKVSLENYTILLEVVIRNLTSLRQISSNVLQMIKQSGSSQRQLTYLRLSYKSVFPVTERAKGQTELALLVSLQEELLQELRRPLEVQVPLLGGVRDVAAVQHHRQRLRLVNTGKQSRHFFYYEINLFLNK